MRAALVEKAPNGLRAWWRRVDVLISVAVCVATPQLTAVSMRVCALPINLLAARRSACEQAQQLMSSLSFAAVVRYNSLVARAPRANTAPLVSVCLSKTLTKERRTSEKELKNLACKWN